MTSSSTMQICIKIWITLSRKIDSKKLVNNEDTISLPPINVTTPIPGQLSSPPPTNPVPRPKLAMTLEEEK